MKKVFLAMLLMVLATAALAEYDPNDGSIYSCNEGNTPELCAEKEQMRQDQAAENAKEYAKRDVRDAASSQK